jgi:putative ABC transport system permease protein
MTLGAVALGVSGLILMGGFVNDMFSQLAESLIHSQTGHLQVQREGYLESGTRTPEKYKIEDPQALARMISKLPGVADVMSRVEFSGLLNNGRSDWPVIGSGVEPDREAALGTSLRIEAGRQLQLKDRDGVMIGKGVASALKLAPGDAVTLLVNTAEGALNSLDARVIGVFESFSKEYDERAIRLPLGPAQAVLISGAVNSLVVKLHETGQTDFVAAAIQANLPVGLTVKTWTDLNDFYSKTVTLYRRQFAVLNVIIMGMIVLSVANSINMTAFERTGEFGTMLALGNTKAGIVRTFVTENILLGVVGSGVGAAVGCLTGQLISWMGISMPPPPGSDAGYTAHIELTLSTVSSAALIGFVSTLLASLASSVRLLKLSPAQALRALH